MFENFTFKPDHQPDAANPVEFELKHLDSPMLFRFMKAHAGDGLEYEDLQMILARNVVGWKGLPQPYSPQSKASLLMGVGNADVLLWLGQCAQELYSRAVLKESERKNS